MGYDPSAAAARGKAARRGIRPRAARGLEFEQWCMENRLAAAHNGRYHPLWLKLGLICD